MERETTKNGRGADAGRPAQKRNYQRELDKVIEGLEREGKKPRLLLHSCCAPCSSYVLEYLSRYFEITVFYYNPNIYPPEEFGKRVEEQKRLIAQLPAEHPISFLDGPYEPERFYEMARGLEQLPEGGERCFKCYRLRLTETAEMARRRKIRLLYHDPVHQPLKERGEAQ